MIKLPNWEVSCVILVWFIDPQVLTLFPKISWPLFTINSFCIEGNLRGNEIFLENWTTRGWLKECLCADFKNIVFFFISISYIFWLPLNLFQYFLVYWTVDNSNAFLLLLVANKFLHFTKTKLDKVLHRFLYFSFYKKFEFFAVLLYVRWVRQCIAMK